MRNFNITHFLVIVIMAMFIFFSVKSCSDKKRYENIIDDYKEIVINNDSLRKTQNGVYQKIVNNLNSEKELSKILKESNDKLYKEIKDSKNKLIQLSRIVATLEDKDNTVNLPDNFITEDTIRFDSFYPDKDNWFINHYGKISMKDSTLTESWRFGELNIDIAITEKTKGVWESNLSAPDYLKINSLEVNSLPEEEISGTKDRFGLLFSGGVLRNWENKDLGMSLSTGVRLGKFSILIGGNTRKDLTGQMVVEF